MQIRKFEGIDIQEALGKAQIALGPEAVILETRRIAQPGSRGISRVELVAAVETRANSPISETESRLSRELQTRTIALSPGRCTSVALIGPTGVGKTTALVKVAAAAREARIEVAFISIDFYRIGAADSLKAYARVLGIPLIVASSKLEAVNAKEKLAHSSLLMIDTAGLPPADRERLTEQSALLEAVEIDETHLCLSATMGLAAIRRSLEAHEPMRPSHILLTKLDEAPEIDRLVSAGLDTGLPFSYLSMGQRIPEDLAAASFELLTHKLHAGVT